MRQLQSGATSTPGSSRGAAFAVRRGLRSTLTVAIVGALLVGGASPTSALPTKLSPNGQPAFAFGTTVNSAGGAGGTVHKPESKLFYTGDGAVEPIRWWAVLGTSGPAPDPGVWLFELVEHSWLARIQLPQADPWSKADVAFEDGTLYVSTRDNMATSGGNARQSSLYKVGYLGGGSWGSVQGPFSITTSNPETLTIARDSANRVWVSYEAQQQITVGYTAPGGTSFTFITVSQSTVAADDISAITAFGGNRIGVFWSDQNAKKDFFAWRPDSASVSAPWTVETAYGGGTASCPTASSDLCADDHMNMKVVGDQIYVAVKTSLNDAVPGNPNDPVTALLRRSSSGTWSSFPVATVSQNVTRPIVLLSPEQDKIWVWGARANGVDVWESSFTSPSFTSTAFTTWTRGSGVSAEDATSTKQIVTAATGAVVESSTAGNATYWHNEFLPVVSNDLPEFDQDLANRTDAENDVISLSAGATDPDGDDLTYAATGLPNGLSIDTATGLISGTVGFNAAAGSPFAVEVTVSEDGGTTVADTDTFTWTVTNTNRAPTFDQDLGNRTNAENDVVTLASPASDLDEDTLTYSATGLPNGLSINASTGEISGTIGFNAAAGSPYSVSVGVSDDGGTTIGATDTFTWTVTNVNREPAFNQNLPDRTDGENAPISLSAAATDPDGDPLTYAATGLPAGLSIDTSTGLISGTIGGSAATGSPYTVELTVSDDGGTTVADTDVFDWTITDANQSPSFDQDLANRTDAENDVISLASPATDPEDDDLTYAATGLPNGLTINASTGLISGTIGFNASAGSPFSTSITVSDNGGATIGDTDTFTWTVTNTNRQPSFNQDLANRSDAEGAAVSLASTATDLDGDTLTYAATGLPNGLSINASTGLISGTVGFNAAAGSPFSVSVTVSDNGGTTIGDTDSFTWTITDANQAPSFDQDLANRADAENDVISLSAGATDPDGDDLTYAATGLPNGLLIDAATGLISGTVGFNAAAGSPFAVEVTVSEDGGTTVADTDTFTWTVTNTNRAPTFDQDLGNRTNAENDVISLGSPASDLDEDTLTYSATGLPNGLSINASTGEISGTIGFNAAAGSPYSVSVRVSDDGGTTIGATDVFTWTVTNVNREPAFNQNLPDRTDGENAPISLSAAGTDPDGDALTYAATGLPGGLSINTSTGLITGTIGNNAVTNSPYSVSITVSENGGVTVADTDTFTWTVTETADIAFRSSSTGANATATSLTINKPATVSFGNVMVAVVDVRSNPTATAPAGWTQVSMTANGTTLRQYVFTKVATGSEPASYTFTFNQSRPASGSILVYSGVSTTNPVETFTAATASSASITAPSATTVANGAMVVGAFSINNSSAIAPPAGMTERGEIASGSNIKTEVADYVQIPAGATGSKTATAGSATANIGQLIVLRPGGPAGPNADPTFNQNLPDRTDAATSPITLSAAATDLEGDTLTYAATGLPTGLSINANTGLISGTIAAGATAGSPYATSITVSDDNGATVGATDTFTWTVTAAPPAPPIAFRSASSGANNTTTSLILPRPAGIVSGDVLVAVVDVRQNPTSTAPAGWTEVSMTPNGTTYRQFVYTKVATGSEPTSYTFAFNQSRRASGAIAAYSGVSTTNPVESFTAGTASSSAITAPSATTVATQAMVVGAFSINNSSAIAPPAGMTERAEIASGSSIKTEIADYVQTSPGATGAKTATAATATANIGQLIVLRPAGPAVNQDPTFDQNLANRTNNEGAAISLSAHATDPENDTLTYAAAGLPTGLSINTSTGLITGTISAGANTNSPFSTSITVSDDNGTTIGATDTFTWTVTVAGPNQDPAFDQNLPDRSDVEGTSITLSAHATDPEGDPLTYAATGLPNGLSISPATGLITGTISGTAAASSPYATSITVSDDNGATVGATDTFTWTVTDPPPGGSIAFRSAAFGANNVGNNVVISTPAGIQSGDVMVAVIDAKSAPTITTPAGWTMLVTTPNGSNFRQAVYFRVATGSEPASTTWSINENRAVSGGIVAYSGVNTANPVEVVGTAGLGTTTAIPAPSVTSAFNGAMIIGAFGINADSAISPPPGMTERGEISSATRLRTEISDFVLATAGATGVKTATAATAAPSIGQLIALRPA